MPKPGGGLIRLRNHVDGPKMNFEFDGWFRLVRALYADRIVRLRPSAPTARSARRIADSEDRSSRSGAIRGWARAISRNVSSPKSSVPDDNRGHGMSWR